MGRDVKEKGRKKREEKKRVKWLVACFSLNKMAVVSFGFVSFLNLLILPRT